MIKKPDDETRKVPVSEVPVKKKKASVKVPMNNAVSQGVKDVLTEKAGMNVINKKHIEKPHFLVVGAGAAFMVVALVISGIIGSGRAKNIGAVESEIRQYQNQIAVQSTTGNAQQKAETVHNSVGLDNQQMAHDSELIGSSLESMLNWSLDDGMERTYRNIQGIYHLPDDSSVTQTFYKGSYAASSFYADSGLTVYCISPISHLRRYACEITWDVTLVSGETVTKSALFMCNVSQVNDNGEMKDMLSELEAYEVWTDAEYQLVSEDADETVVLDLETDTESVDITSEDTDVTEETLDNEVQVEESYEDVTGGMSSSFGSSGQNGGAASLDTEGDGTPIG